MSTTGGTELGTILIVDPPETIQKKVRAAVTDTGREVRRARDKPGISNLVEIMSVATGVTPESIEADYEGQGYGKFKQDVAEAVITRLAPIRERYQRLLARGAHKARETSAPTLEEMYRRMGFVRPPRD